MKLIVPIILFSLIAYLVGGFTWPALEKMIVPEKASSQSKVTLPKDLVKISGCIPFEGEHWVSPKDVDHGPYYVIYNGKLLAVEYMFSPEDIVGEKYAKMTPEQLIQHMQTNNLSLADVVNELRSFSFDMFGAEYKYFDVHWTSPHPGVTHPHYDVHFYLVDKSEMDQVCPEATFQDIFSESLIQDMIKAGIPLPGAPQ